MIVMGLGSPRGGGTPGSSAGNVQYLNKCEILLRLIPAIMHYDCSGSQSNWTRGLGAVRGLVVGPVPPRCFSEG